MFYAAGEIGGLGLADLELAVGEIGLTLGGGACFFFGGGGEEVGGCAGKGGEDERNDREESGDVQETAEHFGNVILALRLVYWADYLRWGRRRRSTIDARLPALLKIRILH